VSFLSLSFPAFLIEFRAREREYQMCNLLGLKSFRTVDMRHRTKCFGAVIKHQDDWIVV
jgi:ribonuclease Z